MDRESVKIAFVCSWGQSSKELLKRYSVYTPSNSCSWDNLRGIDSFDEADYIIGLELPELNKKNVIHFRREPDLIQKWEPPLEAISCFDYSSKEKFHASTWWLEKSYNDLNKLKYSNDNEISVLISNKHKFRTQYVTEVIKSNKNIIGYGSGCGTSQGSNKWRTEILLRSSMSICIENSAQENYFTEKVIDCLLAWTMPLYWGCPNIGNFFPHGSYRLIDIQDPSSIKDIIQMPIQSFEIEAMREARELILNKYNIWACIRNVINDYG
jgi:hypothetical protein